MECKYVGTLLPLLECFIVAFNKIFKHFFMFRTIFLFYGFSVCIGLFAKWYFNWVESFAGGDSVFNRR